DEAAHSGDALFQYGAFAKPPSVGALEACMQLAPDALVRPIGDVLVRCDLQIESRDLRRAHAVEREAMLVVGVDQLVLRRRRLREDAQPGERVRPLEDAKYARWDRLPADPVKAVAAGDCVASELGLLAIGMERDPRSARFDVVHGDVTNFEQDRAARAEPR